MYGFPRAPNHVMAPPPPGPYNQQQMGYSQMMPDPFMSTMAVPSFPRPPKPKGMYSPQMQDPMGGYMQPAMGRSYSYSSDPFAVPQQSSGYSSGPKTRRVNDPTTDMIWKSPTILHRVDNNNPPKSRVFFSLQSHVPASVLAGTFMAHGEVESVYFIKTRRLCGYAKFATAEAAASAVAMLNGSSIRPGVNISMSIASPQKTGLAN